MLVTCFLTVLGLKCSDDAWRLGGSSLSEWKSWPEVKICYKIGIAHTKIRLRFYSDFKLFLLKNSDFNKYSMHYYS